MVVEPLLTQTMTPMTHIYANKTTCVAVRTRITVTSCAMIHLGLEHGQWSPPMPRVIGTDQVSWSGATTSLLETAK